MLAARHGREITIMAASNPANPGNHVSRSGGSRSRDPGEFDALVDRGFREHSCGPAGAPLAADLEPRQLLRYAAGRTSGDDRSTTEAFVARSSWAYERVVALVRARRPGSAALAGTLARGLLDPAERPAAAIVASAILEAEGDPAGPTGRFDEAWTRLEKAGSPRGRGACLLGLGRLDDAKKVLEGQDRSDPATTLLRRAVAAARTASPEERDDATLLALLDAFPSIVGDRLR